MAVRNPKMLSPDEEGHEEQPLLLHRRITHRSKKPRCCSCFSFTYRLVKMTEKGGILMIVFNTLFAMAMITCYQNATFEPLNINTKLLTIPSLLVLLLCPILGLLSECYFGKYKIFQISIYSLLVGLVLSALSIITTSINVRYVALVPLFFSTICYASCIIPLTMDQLVGASGEELSFTMYWLVWPVPTSISIMRLLDCSSLLHNHQYKHLTLFVLSALLYVTTFSLVQCFNHLLVTRSLISNPIKLVVQVLNYARKHKFPERRSAFTYWEEECPSRIDLGKEKYGGPFTFEEVEDVKTALKLVLLISIVVPISGLEFASEVEVHNIGCHGDDLRFWLNCLWYFFAVFSLPIYQFLVYPFFYNYIPSMLKRIGLGMLIAVLSKAVISVTELYAIEQTYDEQVSKTFTCLNSENKKFPVIAWIVSASHSTTKVGLMIMTLSIFEFVAAQTPYKFRGLVTSLTIGLACIFMEIGVVLYESIPNHCVVIIGTSVMSLGMFVVLVIVAWRYKLRKRNDIISYHMFAENQFESDYRQKQMYANDSDWSD